VQDPLYWVDPRWEWVQAVILGVAAACRAICTPVAKAVRAARAARLARQAKNQEAKTPSSAAKTETQGGDAGVCRPAEANQPSKTALTTERQLQKKFKHAESFGVEGNYSPANAQRFDQAIQKHLNAPGTQEISGTYRGNPVTFHTNPNTGLTVIQETNGRFLSGWKFNPQQLQRILQENKL
jgi:hypothetical protein